MCLFRYQNSVMSKYGPMCQHIYCKKVNCCLYIVTMLHFLNVKEFYFEILAWKSTVSCLGLWCLYGGVSPALTDVVVRGFLVWDAGRKRPAGLGHPLLHRPVFCPSQLPSCTQGCRWRTAGAQRLWMLQLWGSKGGWNKLSGSSIETQLICCPWMDWRNLERLNREWASCQIPNTICINNLTILGFTRV